MRHILRRVIYVRAWSAVLIASLCLAACSPSSEGSIDKLSGGPDERAMGKHELLLAKAEAIEPVIAALAGPDHGQRSDLAEVMVNLSLRLEDDRISAALKKHLVDDSDPGVRARIADRLGLHIKEEYIEAFMRAVTDPSPRVRAPAMNALSNVLDKLSEEQILTLRGLATQNAGKGDRDVREAALFLVEEFVARLAHEAREEALKANLPAADSIYNRALAYAPTSKQANYYMGTYYYEYGDRERGFQLLRENSLLLDVPRFSSPPKIDGRLDDPIWNQAVKIETFYSYGFSRTSLPARVPSHALVGYSDQALYLGVRCYDAHPESLVVKPFDDASYGNARQDLVELFFDRNRDQTTFSVVKINTDGSVRDGRNDYSKGNTRDLSWDLEGAAAVFVGNDFWSFELQLNWDAEQLHRPDPGDLAGMNIHRLFRASEYSQPFRDYDENRAPGYLLFE